MAQVHKCACYGCDSELDRRRATRGIGRFGVSLGDGMYYKVFERDAELMHVQEVDTQAGWVIETTEPPHVCQNCHKDVCTSFHRSAAIRMVEHKYA